MTKVLLETGASPRGWHRLQNMLECPQKYSYQYNLGIEPLIPAQALMKGSLVHLALAHHYTRKKAEDIGEDKDQFFNPFEAIREKCNQSPEFGEFASNIEDVIDAYQRYWMVENRNWRVLEVEQLAYAIIEDPQLKGENGEQKKYLLTGRFDMVLENINTGDILVVDHKTTSRLSSAHQNFYSVSGQLIGYEYMARKIFGDRLKGVMLNLIQLTSPYKFNRIVLTPRPNLVAHFEQTVIDAERRIAELENSGRDPMNYPKAMNELTCFTRYGACQYLDTCKFGIGAVE